MRKWVILAVVLAVLAGGVAIALVNLNSYLNRNRDWLASQVEAALGRKVSFSEIGVQLFGGFGARIKDLRIADDPAFSKNDFLKAGDVEVSMALWPALFGRYEVKRVILKQPDVTIIKTKDGANYETIGKKPEQARPAPPPKGPTPEVAPAAPKPKEAQKPEEKAALLVGLVDIEKGQIHYVDRTTSPATDVRVADLDFSASDVSFDRPIHLKLATALFGASKQNVKLDGTLGPLGQPADVQHAPLDLSLEIRPLVIDDVKKLGAAATQLKEVSSPDPISVDAKVSGKLAERLKIDADVDASGAALRYGNTFQKPKGTAMKLKLAAERAGNAIDVKSLSLRLAELELAAKGTVDTSPGGTVDVQIDSQKAPLAGWDRLLPAFAGHQVSGTFEAHVRAKTKTGSTEQPNVTGAVTLAGVNAKEPGSPYEIEDLNGRIDLKGASASIPTTTFKLSGSPVEVQAEVPTLKPLTATFSLKSPQLSAASLAFASPTVEKPERLRGLDIKGQFRAGEKSPEFQGTLRSTDGSLRDFDYRDLAADLTLRDRVATLTKLSLKAFDGSYDGSGRYDMGAPDNPKFDFRSAIRAMDLKTLLASRSPGSEKRIEGKLDADLTLSGSGKQWDVVKKQLRGNGRVDVRDGVIKDVNIADEVLKSVTGIAGLSSFISPRVRQRHPTLFSTTDTKFDKLGGSVAIADGVARSDDVTILARDYAMLGKGTYSLDNDLDFAATLLASRDLSDDVIADLREAKYLANSEGKIEIPFRLTGSLPHVKPKPDAEFIARAMSRAVVGKGLDKIFGKQKSPPPGVEPTPDRKHPERELLRKGLEGLFGR